MKNLKLKSVAYLVMLLVVFTACQKEEPLPEEDGIGHHDGHEVSGIALYQVRGDDIIEIQGSGNSEGNNTFADRDKHQEIWELVKRIIPLDYRSKMNEFQIYLGQEDGTAGFVHQTSNDLSTWRMGIAIDYAYEGGFNKGNELSYTIIHEFGHILSLNNAQVDAGTSEDACGTAHVGEGCVKRNSYLHNMYTRFWADIYESSNKKKGLGEFGGPDIYNNYRDRFVTEYASSNIVEDFAEVFAYFVTQDHRPSGSTVAEKKINMLYEFDELISLRNYIRNGGNARSSGGTDILPEPGAWRGVHRR